MPYHYVERDQKTGRVLYAETGASIEEIACKVGFDWEDAANLWAGAATGNPVIDDMMSGKNGIIYSREFHFDNVKEG